MPYRYPLLRLLLPSLLLVLVLTALPLSGCASEPESLEEQVRAMIAQAEAAAEERDLEAIKALISETYRDERGNSKQNVASLVTLYFLQNRSIYLLTRIDMLAVADSMQAEASVLVAMAGQPIGEASILTLARAALYRFDFTFADEGEGDWKVMRATWQRAEAGDFF